MSEEGMSLWWSASDEEVIREADRLNKARIPVYRIPLRTVWPDQEDVAEVDFSVHPATVRRFKHGSGFANDAATEGK
jgi:hypothetical protein